ncbi:MAG: phosphatidylserine/phosphatidylglycerophosphate/cardiolipin synthase family protein [Kofleriaceae bacterium]|nr:phosphatidylserine/phosphatidylglycerophosphate/cardiolipin synthase family protein [Kofleriaceae bacterium]
MTVERGASSARGARELVAKKVALFSLPGLHAKVYIFDDSAIVASANLSSHSSVLIEAGVLVTSRQELRALRAFANQARGRALPVGDDTYLKELAKREPKHLAPPSLPRPHVGTSPKIAFTEGDDVWVCTCQPDKKETKAERKAKARHATDLSEVHGLPDESSVEWINGCTSETKRALAEFHYCFYWWKPAPGEWKTTYGYLDGPWQSLGGLDLGKQFGDRRYCVPNVKRRRRMIRIDRERLEVLADALGRTIPADPRDLWHLIDKGPAPAKLSRKGIATLIGLMRESR